MKILCFYNIEMKVSVRTAGAIQPNRPLTPLELAMMLQDYVGKVCVLDVNPDITVQALCDLVDAQLGINPASTFQETLMEGNIVLDKSKSLGTQNVNDGDELYYRFVIIM